MKDLSTVYNLRKVTVGEKEGYPVITLFLDKNLFKKGQKLLVIYLFPLDLLQILSSCEELDNKQALELLAQRIYKELLAIFEYSTQPEKQ